MKPQKQEKMSRNLIINTTLVIGFFLGTFQQLIGSVVWETGNYGLVILEVIVFASIYYLILIFTQKHLK